MWIEPLQQLPKPIFSRRRRRLVFIPTTWDKFCTAAEINDLYDESPLEDRLWAQFKQLAIGAERQELVTMYCVPKIVETINYLGGLPEEGKLLPRKIDLNRPAGAYQLGLFDSV